MSKVLGFSISNLAGRPGTIEHELDSHINVFYGMNGCGKTSLLRLLHSAMRTDASDLVACSPKLDPGVMRVSTAVIGKEILDEQTEATEP